MVHLLYRNIVGNAYLPRVFLCVIGLLVKPLIWRKKTMCSIVALDILYSYFGWLNAFKPVYGFVCGFTSIPDLILSWAVYGFGGKYSLPA